MAEDTNPNPNDVKDENGGGGGDPALDAKIQAAVEGLKRNNSELKGEKTELKERLDGLTTQLEQFGGLDTLKALGNAETVKTLLEMKKRFEADEQGKMLSEGKYDEWFDKRTASLRKDHENQMRNLQAQIAERDTQLAQTEDALRKKFLETEVSNACRDVQVESSAVLDVQLRAASVFHFDKSRNRLVIKDDDGGVVFGKDGSTPKTIREWLEDQKEVSRHWWPRSKGGGAEGSDLPGGKSSDLARMDFATFAKAREKQGFRPF